MSDQVLSNDSEGGESGFATVAGSWTFGSAAAKHGAQGFGAALGVPRAAGIRQNDVQPIGGVRLARDGDGWRVDLLAPNGDVIRWAPPGFASVMHDRKTDSVDIMWGEPR
jgi:hypothetical protein